MEMSSKVGWGDGQMAGSLKVFLEGSGVQY
jgi:hypothetical protein